ncbi:MAG: PEP-CTERM sorting domain-containing protein [Akkermansiaceae bacterium]
MKIKLITLGAIALTSVASQAALSIVGVIDGDLSGGNPKAIILLADSVTDLSTWAVGSANNGGGTDGEEFTLSGSATAGQYIIITGNSDSTSFFSNNFGSSGFVAFENGAANINGDDAIELFSSSSVVDTYGDINADGTGETWEYQDGYAVRTGGSAGAFVEANYAYFNGALDTLDEAAQAAALGAAFNDFSSSTVPEPSSTALLGLGGLAILLRRRK